MLTERITAQMADAHPLHVPLSFGISGPGDDPTVVIRTADEALYRVKRERRERAAA
jgi:GGDEF domain-containing protein